MNVTSAALFAGALCCTPLDPANDFFGADAGLASLVPAAPSYAALDEPSAVVGCAPIAQRPLRELGAPGDPLAIEMDAAWTCSSNYRLRGPVLVAAGAALRIGPDTRIDADAGAFLLVQRGARLLAQGERRAPIVFTSARAPGERAPGDWRGLILAGGAPSQGTNAAVPGALGDPRAFYGGGASGDAAHDCGRLRFVRIEFAGGAPDEEATPAAAFTLAACGTATEVDHVQVHRATDGVGLIGGTVRLTHVIVSNNGIGDAVEWTAGYTGSLQYVVAQSAGAAAAFKGSNSSADGTRAPVSHPIIFNATAVGIRPALRSGRHLGLLAQLGSELTFANSVIAGFDDGAIDLRSAQTVAAVSPEQVSHVVVHDNGRDGSAHLTRAAAALAESIVEGDPGLGAASHVDRPDFVPRGASVTTRVRAPLAELDAAAFHGALAPTGEDWTRDWTAYPLD